MRTVVCTGGRNYCDAGMVSDVLTFLRPDRVLVGDCPTGADREVEDWCNFNDVPLVRFYANWNKHGKAAGPMRNKEMLNAVAGASDVVVIAFPGGRGTADCMRQAVKLNMIVLEVKP